jgi:hypothetical protein
MSQHYFNTTFDGEPVTVILGWDRPLGHFFLLFERSAPAGQLDGPEPEVVYSNLEEPDPFHKDLAFYRENLNQLGIRVPESMFREVPLDQASGVDGNRMCWHESNGLFKEAMQ